MNLFKKFRNEASKITIYASELDRFSLSSHQEKFRKEASKMTNYANRMETAFCSAEIRFPFGSFVSIWIPISDTILGFDRTRPLRLLDFDFCRGNQINPHPNRILLHRLPFLE